MSLPGKVAVVTGAASGLGLGIAKELSAHGATVVISDVREPEAEAAAAGIERAEAVACDVTDEGQVEALMAGAFERHGRLDVAVANAGILNPPCAVVEYELDEWRHVMSVNLDAVMLTIKHAGRIMAANGGGAIVAISSVTAVKPVPLTAAYAAAKAGVSNLVKSAALELRDAGVRVNAVLPGFVDTPMLQGAAPHVGEALGIEDFTGMLEQVQGSLLEPADIANMVAYLASDAASFCSGGEYVVDNGITPSVF